MNHPPIPSLLAVFAHPDDESLLAGGVLAQHHAAGARTAVVTATWAPDSRRAPDLADALAALGAGPPTPARLQRRPQPRRRARPAPARRRAPQRGHRPPRHPHPGLPSRHRHHPRCGRPVDRPPRPRTHPPDHAARRRSRRTRPPASRGGRTVAAGRAVHRHTPRIRRRPAPPSARRCGKGCARGAGFVRDHHRRRHPLGRCEVAGDFGAPRGGHARAVPSRHPRPPPRSRPRTDHPDRTLHPSHPRPHEGRPNPTDFLPPHTSPPTNNPPPTGET